MIHLPDLSGWRVKSLICSLIWTIPLVTSLTALIMGALGPAGTNWCDITAVRPVLRYALVNGWRLAIMLLAMCFYIFIWCFVHQNYSFFSATASARTQPKPETQSSLIGPILVSTLPPRFSTSHSSIYAASRPNRHKRGTLCSDFSLPLQGHDSSGPQIQESETAVDNRTERISRWIRVRHPGMINSISSFKSQSQSKLLTPQVSPKRPATHAVTFTAEPECQGRLLSSLPPPCPPPSTRPNYHSQCPKVKRSFDISVEDRSGIATSELVTRQRQSPESHYHEPAKSVKSIGARTQSSLDTVPWRIRSAGQMPGHEVQWPFFDRSRSPVQSSESASMTASLEAHLSSGPHCHSLSPKTTGFLDACNSHSDQSQSRGTVGASVGGPDAKERYASRLAPPQAVLPRHRYDKTEEQSGSIHQNRLIAKDATGGPVERMRNDANSVPKYHSQCPKVKQTFEVSVDTPRETRPGPKYHSQCPKVTKTVSVLPSGPSLPKTPSFILRPDICTTKTTIITAPEEPPPSPTPGLPPPPWSPEVKAQRRKTFLLSRSTWSDSTTSQQSPSTRDVAKNDREIRRMLLLNAYPLAYFILSLPWMVNCFIEAQGHESQYQRAMHVLLGLPQYLGLVNAIIFLINEWLKAIRRKARTAEVRRVTDEKDSFDSDRGRYGIHTWGEQ